VLLELLADEDAAVVGVVVADFPPLALWQAYELVSRHDSSHALACSTLECRSCSDVSKQSDPSRRCRVDDATVGLLFTGIVPSS
jgi:hypothetical protein